MLDAETCSAAPERQNAGDTKQWTQEVILVARPTVWHGTEAELRELERAAQRNCRQHDNLPCDELCAHRLLGKQRYIDGLVFMRRLRERLEFGEHGLADKVS